MNSTALFSRRAILSIPLAAIGLLGCATPSSRLGTSRAPIGALWIVTFPGVFASLVVHANRPDETSAPLAAAIHRQFPEAFRRNAVIVAGALPMERALADLDEVQLLWRDKPASAAAATHMLVLTGQRSTSTSVSLIPVIEYEVVLWDAAARELVWKAQVKSSFGGRDLPDLADGLARDVLEAMHKDGLINLPRGQASAMASAS